MGENSNILKKVLETIGMTSRIVPILQIKRGGRQVCLQVGTFVSTWEVMQIVKELDQQRSNLTSGSGPKIPSSLDPGLLPTALVRGGLTGLTID